LEFYEDVNEVVKEKSILVRETKKGGAVLLNADDGRVFQMKGRAKTKVKTFGFSDRAEIRAKDFRLTGDKDNPSGVEFTLNYETEEHKVELPNVFDQGSVYSVLIAIGVGISAGIPIYRLVESCKKYLPPKGRMRLIEGEKCLIIDSSYNAAPKSVELALETVDKLDAKRKVAILGDMLELGDLSEETHRKMGDKVQFLDVLITIGKDSKQIHNKFNKEKYHFENSEEAVDKINSLIKNGDLVLVKGSQSIRTEKIVEKLMKEDPKDLLVRQYHPWKSNGKN
jgi:UDP-N-acetylmuramoyl-tripeptide--D-alanyl-D-alanine ligase